MRLQALSVIRRFRLQFTLPPAEPGRYDTEMSPIKIDPEILGGTPCFTGTRVPVSYLFEHLRSGATIDEFLEGFPSVSRELAIAVLDLASEKLPLIEHVGVA